ncbi:MAG: DUF1189 domain-containing protein [Legionella sp.]|nr:MAG: DUF1189 domain-containing protein [Legionella sp.]
MDARAYGYWSALYHSFYSRALYVDVGKRWRGIGLRYLLLVVALFAIPFSIRVGITYNQFFKQQLIEPLLKLPTIYVQNGQASIEKPVPYIIKNSLGQVVLIVDTSDTITDFTDKYPNLTILINKEKLSYRLPTPQLFSGNQPEQTPSLPVTQNYSKQANSVFDGKKLVGEGSLNRVKYISQSMIYPIVVAVLMSLFMVLFPVLALLGQVFARVFFSFQLVYGQAVRLLIVSATPMMLLLFIFLTFNILFPGMGIILTFITFAYYSFAVAALRSASRQVAAS